MSSTPKHMPLVKLCGILHGFFHLKLPEKSKKVIKIKNKKKSSVCAGTDAAGIVTPLDRSTSSYPLYPLSKKYSLIL